MNIALSLIVGITMMFNPATTGQDFNPRSISGDCPVLVYHNIVENAADISDSSWETTTNKFEEDIIAILNAGYTPVFTHEIYQSYSDKKFKLPQKPIIITFDDGYLSNYKLAFNILKKYNVKAEIYVITDSVGTTPNAGKPHFSWKQASEMETSGLVYIQLHGKTHQNVTDLSEKQIRENFLAGVSAIEKNLGKRKMIAYSYPGGVYSPAIMGQLTSLGAKVQYIWRGEENNKISKMPYMLRNNVTYTTDVASLLKSYK